MLEIRPNCEHCGKALPNDSDQAMICTYECTFCADCVTHLLENVCPNCGGGFEKRPTRPHRQLAKHPGQTDPLIKPVDFKKFEARKNLHKDIAPRNR